MKRNRLIIDNKKIEREVKEYYRKIRNTKSDLVKATNCRLIATALEQLENPSAEIKQEIENCYKEAIRLNPNKKKSYLADLSNFYISINNIEGAIQNISTIEETKQELTGAERDYVNKTVDNLERLNNIIKQIKSKVERGEITQEYADSQIALIEVVQNHDHRIKITEQSIKACLIRLDLVEEEQKINKSQIEIVNDKVETLSDQIEIINYKLKKTGINDKARLKEQIEGLEQYKYEGEIIPALNESLKDYANSFYWILANKILAYRVLDTKIIEGQVWENTAAKQLEFASNTITKIGSIICKSVPMYGGTASAVFDIMDIASSVALEVVQLYTNAKNERMVELVNYELFFGRDNLVIDPEGLISQGLLSGAIEIALGKSDIINRAITDPASNKPIAGILNQISDIKKTFIEGVIDPIVNTFFEVDVVHLNEVQKIAIADSALFMIWLTDQRSGKQEKEAFTKGINNPQELGQKIANLYNEEGAITHMLDDFEFITNIKTYIQAIKECVGGIRETANETRELGSDIPDIAGNIREHGKDEIIDKTKKDWQHSKLCRLVEKVKTKIDSFRNNNKAYEIDFDDTGTDTSYDNDLSDHSKLIVKFDTREIVNLSEGTSNVVLYEVEMSGNNNSAVE